MVGFLVYRRGKRKGWQGGGYRVGGLAAIREGGERSGGEKTERRGCDELTTLRSGAPPRCTADTCRLADLPTCQLVGKSETWRVGGVRVVREG